MTVQPGLGMVMPLKERFVAPATKVFGVVPAQVPVTAPPTALLLDSVSVKEPLVRLEALVLESVSVTVEVPPDAIAAGAKALAIVGATNTVRLALLLAAPAVGVCVVVTPEVELGCTPAVLLVTEKMTVQLGLGTVMPVKERVVAPATR